MLLNCLKQTKFACKSLSGKQRTRDSFVWLPNCRTHFLGTLEFEEPISLLCNEFHLLLTKKDFSTIICVCHRFLFASLGVLLVCQRFVRF